MKLTSEEIKYLQERYFYLTNYESVAIDDPIDPLTYVDSNGDWLIHIATSLGDLKGVELLLKAGIDVNQVGDMGCTPLHYAKMKNNDVIADFLLKNGALNSIENDFGKLPGEN